MPGGDRALHEEIVWADRQPTNLKFRSTSTDDEGRERGIDARPPPRTGRTPQLLGRRVGVALDDLGHADPRWLWLAGLGFVVCLVGAAGAWRSAIGLCDGSLSLGDACCRFGAGSLANTLLPARAGDAVRIALFSRAIPHANRLRTAGGAYAALAASRAAVLGALVVGGAAAGVVPLWPLLAAAGLVAIAVAVAALARRTKTHLLDAFRALGDDPRSIARLAAWNAGQLGGRLAAATAV